jgi:hypothetical protein
MSKTAVVSSCSAKGWEEYGERFVASYKRFWPSDIPLYLVSEDELPPQKGLTLLSLHLSEPATAFLNRHKDDARAHGRVMKESDQGWKASKIARGYNFRYDAFRFAKKVFAIDYVARTFAQDIRRLFWVDGDVVTFAPLPRQMLDRVLPRTSALSCLDRGQYHSECGFVGYNLEHPATRDFIARFAALYASDAVFELQEWHDSWVFDYLRHQLQLPTFAIPHRSRSHPFVNSELGRVMDHKKGDRKNYGRTPYEQLVINKDVRYYRKIDQ